MTSDRLLLPNNFSYKTKYLQCLVQWGNCTVCRAAKTSVGPEWITSVCSSVLFIRYLIVFLFFYSQIDSGSVFLSLIPGKINRIFP